MRLILLAILLVTLNAQPSDDVIYQSWVRYEIDLKGKTWPFDAQTNATETAYKANFILLDTFINTDPKVAEYDLGQTLYSDISANDFKNNYLLKEIIPSYGQARSLSTQGLPVKKVWDLAEQNAPDFGAHSWASSAVASVEAYFNREIVNPANYVRLATQQIIDCVENGKSPLDALTWIKENGIDLRSQYTIKNCQPKTQNYKIQDIRIVKAEKDQLKAALQFTPVSVCFDLTNFQQYIGGVINEGCTAQQTNYYCGLLTGYQNDEWIIQTTLGQLQKEQELFTFWGEEGIVKFHADIAHCGVQNFAVFPMLTNEDIQEYKADFVAYQNNFNKVYDSHEEEQKRFKIWAYAQLDNQDVHYFGNTQFTDLTEDEFIQQKLITDFTFQLENKFISDDSITADENIDWRTKTKIVPEVFDQEDCISSWAISSKHCLESYFRQQTSKAVKLSLQELIDCSDNQEPLKGCQKGIPTNALSYIKNKGLNWESNYPYTGKAQACDQDIKKQTLRPTSYKKLDSLNAVTQALQVRPAVVCFNASKLQSYTKGTITTLDCAGSSNNYCGLLVGKTTEYWIVQGSFGTTWGQNGYVHIAYGDNCGILSNAFTII